MAKIPRQYPGRLIQAGAGRRFSKYPIRVDTSSRSDLQDIVWQWLVAHGMNPICPVVQIEIYEDEVQLTILDRHNPLSPRVARILAQDAYTPLF